MEKRKINIAENWLKGCIGRVGNITRKRRSEISND